MKTCNDAPVGYTDHPMMDIWQGWNGGSCPVHPLATVEYVMAGGGLCKDRADQLDWESTGIDDWDIIAYRIVEEYKPEPEKVAREVWIMTDDAGYMYFCGEGDHKAARFVEVLE